MIEMRLKMLKTRHNAPKHALITLKPNYVEPFIPCGNEEAEMTQLPMVLQYREEPQVIKDGICTSHFTPEWKDVEISDDE